MTPAAPKRTKAYVSKGVGKFKANNAVIIPLDTPIIPRALPTLAVFYEARPLIPPIQHKLAVRYPIVKTLGIPEAYAPNKHPIEVKAGIAYK